VAWSIVFFSDARGRELVLESIEGLPAKQHARLLADLRVLETLGPALGMPHARHMGDGLWELRTRVGSDIFRSFYFTWTGRRFVILHVFEKKTQKTPEQELRRATERRKNWLARHPEDP